MSRHYNSTRPFVWLRKKLNIKKPTALPWGGWEVWDKELKSTRPIAYFLTETLPDLLELPAKWLIDPINDLRYRVRLQFVYKTHYLQTGLKPGHWYEFETRTLHGMFNELVNFVEIEKANHAIAWGGDEVAVKYHVPWWRRVRLFYWGEWRCPKAGIDHLKWEMELDNPDSPDYTQNSSQAVSARELMILYVWWTKIRVKREESSAYDEVGYTEYSRELDEKYGCDWMFSSARISLTAAEQVKRSELGKAAHELEEAWYKEDEDMLIRLVKLRRTMWT